MARYFIVTFGCQANKADSQRLATALESQGFAPAASLGSAEIVVINSCVVRQAAEDRIYGLITKLKNKKQFPKLKRIILTGCLAGWALRDKTGGKLKELRARVGPRVEIRKTEELADFSCPPKRELAVNQKDLAYIPICWGCNQFCSYCIVPFARGRLWHRPGCQILLEVRQAVAQGRPHIILLGESVNSWQNPNKGETPKTFPQLLAAVAETKGVRLVEFISPNPWDFSDELIEVIACHPNISRTIHLPLQSGDDHILAKMKRPYTAAEFLKLVERIRARIPEARFTTDIIVGFPGEDEKAFANTVAVCQKVGFVRAFIACYSPRPGTLAARSYPDDVPPNIKKRRLQILDQLINQKNKPKPQS